MKFIGVIPARWQSTRFPGKMLTPIAGKPLIQWVAERASRSRLLSEVIVATDHQPVADCVAAFVAADKRLRGRVRAVMTRPDHPSGTDRVAEVARKILCDIVVNIQGDEPLLQPAMIDQLARALARDRTAVMATLAKAATADELDNPNVVKLIVNRQGRAIYFSRHAIPYLRDAVKEAAGERLKRFRFLKHPGMYAYRRDFLLKLVKLPPSPLELAERLEQLRVIENGYTIKVVETKIESIGVDAPADVARVETLIKEQ
ncbi:MAG: 3-deoxy-manno-octulosonate cytidylyltransferase [Verrucomicrobia bacterium]|nr:3-deoxy-manno-octulosonate cytidylyltransferase [Verrucomicrobiota bacterium]